MNYAVSLFVVIKTLNKHLSIFNQCNCTIYTAGDVLTDENFILWL